MSLATDNALQADQDLRELEERLTAECTRVRCDRPVYMSGMCESHYDQAISFMESNR